MPAKRQIILDPFVSEFVYSCIMNSTIEQRKQLNGKFLYATRTSKKAKTFSVKSTDEEKRILLSKLGIEFAWVFNISKDKLDQLFETTGKKTLSELTKVMIEQKVMVVTDKQVMTFLGVMASNCHSESWLINREYLNFGYRIKEWRREYEHPTNREMKEMMMVMRDMAKAMLNTILASKSIEDQFGVSETAMTVLLYLISRQKEFVTEFETKTYLRGMYREFRVNVALKSLISLKYVERNAGETKPEYRITGMGVNVALSFQKKALTLLNF